MQGENAYMHMYYTYGEHEGKLCNSTFDSLNA